MVSVIIPIYNVSSFIQRGIEYIKQQTYEDFEVIMVDDGSTDDSLSVCRALACNDKRIRVLTQSNQGAGAARNLGMEHARGEYIYFFDIDDQIDSKLLAYCVDDIETKQVDLVVFGYRNVETSYECETVVDFPNMLIQSNRELKNIFVDQFVIKVNGFPWNKFYRKSFLDKYGIRFENQRIQQDEVFNLMVYEHLNRAYLSSRVLYTYYIYNSGNTRSRFIPDRFDIYKSVRLHFERLIDFWNLRDERLSAYLCNRFYHSVLQCLLFNINHPRCPWTKQEKRNEIERVMRDAYTQEAFAYVQKCETGLEQRLYRSACTQQSVALLHLYSSLFVFLRRVKWKMRLLANKVS